jgi:hypothetical protein
MYYEYVFETLFPFLHIQEKRTFVTAHFPTPSPRENKFDWIIKSKNQIETFSASDFSLI